MTTIPFYRLQCPQCGFERIYMIVPRGTTTILNRDAIDLETPEPVQALPRHCPSCRHKLEAAH